MHPPLEEGQPQPPMRPHAHHPLAQRLRQKIYSKSEHIALRYPKGAMTLIEHAIGELPDKQKAAIRKLPHRALGQAEPIVAESDAVLPPELSDMIHEYVLLSYIRKTLQMPPDATIQMLAEVAAMRGRDDLIAYLIRLDAEPNGTADTIPLLLSAIQSGNVSTVDKLLACGADASWKDSKGRSYLYYAVIGRSDVQMIQRFMTPIDAQQQRSYESPLSTFAFHDDNVEVLQLFLDNGAEKEWQTEVGTQSLISWAVEYDATKCLEVLLKAGSSPNVFALNLDRRTRSVLDAAMLKRNVASAALLLKFNASLFNPYGRYALEYAILFNRIEFVSMLVEAEMDPLSPQALNVLRVALMDNNGKAVTAILEGGIDPNGSSQGLPMLCHALLMRNFEMADLLYDYKADVPNQEVDGIKLLHWPGLSEDAEAKQWLLDHGAIAE